MHVFAWSSFDDIISSPLYNVMICSLGCSIFQHLYTAGRHRQGICKNVAGQGKVFWALAMALPFVVGSGLPIPLFIFRALILPVIFELLIIFLVANRSHQSELWSLCLRADVTHSSVVGTQLSKRTEFVDSESILLWKSTERSRSKQVPAS